MVYFYEYCSLAQVAVLLMLGLYWTVWDRYMQLLYLGGALRTKETLPDFLKWGRVTRHPLVFRGLTGSQRTPGFGASQPGHKQSINFIMFLNNLSGIRKRYLICMNNY